MTHVPDHRRRLDGNLCDRQCPDRRLNAWRRDLADRSLIGRVPATRFVDGTAYHVAAVIASVHTRPEPDADLDTQALRGEAVTVFEIADGWAWGQLAGDGYVGYLPASALAAGAPRPATHRVIAPEAFSYVEPRAAARPLRSWLFGAPLSVIGDSGLFFELAEGFGFIGKRHAASLGAGAPDFVETARAFLHTPYLWGGKSRRGIDCSGLVQLALQRAGIACPRDTDMQQLGLPGDLEITHDIVHRLQRGDIVYWPRHVGIMLDGGNLLHASGTLMTTGIEPVEAVIERSRGSGPAVSAVKRLMPSDPEV